MTVTQNPQTWKLAYRSWDAPTTPVADVPEPTVEADPSLPTFEILLDGSVFASTQVPARAKKMVDGMTSGPAALRYGLHKVELRVVNDRRSVAR